MEGRLKLAVKNWWMMAKNRELWWKGPKWAVVLMMMISNTKLNFLVWKDLTVTVSVEAFWYSVYHF